MIHKLFMTGLLGCIGFWSASAQPRVLGVEELFRLADAHSKSLKVHNLAVDEALAAEDGVYASLVEVGGVRYRAMSNLGRNPSVGGQPRHLETHLFGFEGSLYGREVRVVLLRKVRDERRFDTVEELRAQIARDKEQILNLKMNLK